jgi:hypothetical protein
MESASLVWTLWRLIDRLSKLVRLTAVDTSIESCTEQIRKSFCEFQLRFTNYQYTASRHHREFKNHFFLKPNDSSLAYGRLNAFLERGFKNLCADSTMRIVHYFTETHRHKIGPRVSIIMKDDRGHLVGVVSLPNWLSDPVEWSGNDTSFLDVAETGLPHLTNNIPEAAKRTGVFCHSKLDVDKIRKSYQYKRRDNKLWARFRNNILRREKKDVLWGEMRAGTKTSTKWLPKSQLIVPITFRAHANEHRLDSGMVFSFLVCIVGI